MSPPRRERYANRTEPGRQRRFKKPSKYVLGFIPRQYFNIAVIVVLSIIALSWLSSCEVCGRDAEQIDSPNNAQNGIVTDFTYSVRMFPFIPGSGKTVPVDYAPGDLTAMPAVPGGSYIMLRFDAAAAFTEMYEDMVSVKLSVILIAGHKSYNKSAFDHNNQLSKLKDEGMFPDDAAMTARMHMGTPDADEHRLGTTVSLGIDFELRESFQNTAQYKWLAENAYKYGFICRFPKEYLNETGRLAPWEFRYVGREEAKYIAGQGICLEEYVRRVRSNSRGSIEEPLYTASDLAVEN